MSDKVNKDQIKDIIKEFKANIKINREPIVRYPTPNSKSSTIYEPGHVYKGSSFPENPGKKGESLYNYEDYSKFSSQRKGNIFLFSKDAPFNQLSISDIESLFRDASYDKGTSMGKTEKLYAFRAAFLALRDFGTIEEKRTWDNSISLMIKNNKHFKAAMDDKKFGADFGFLGEAPDLNDKETMEAVFNDNWTLYKIYSKINTDTLRNPIDSNKIAFDKDKVQKKRDLFNIDMRNYGSEVGTFPAEVASAMDLLFSDTNSLKGRLETITKFTEDMGSILESKNPQATFKGVGLQKMISALMITDYLNSIVEDLDSGSSAYMFEAFCAAIAGGKVEGKSKTDSGKMGAVDFTIGEFGGSSKYYSNYAQISQAVNGFEDAKPIYYVVALKNKEDDKVISIDLYHYVVVVDRSDGTNDITIMTSDGVELHPKPRADAGEDILLNKASYYQQETHIGTFKILRASREDLETFRGAVTEVAQTLQTSMSQIIPKMASIQENSEEFSTNLNLYAIRGKSKDGNEALNSLIELKQMTKELFDLFHKEEGYQKVDTKNLKESTNVSRETLKQIIKKTIGGIK